MMFNMYEGRDHDDVGLEVLDQLDLLLGLTSRHRDHRAAETFSTVMGTQAPGKQTVAVRDVADVARSAAGGADRARNEVGPGVDVLGCVAHHRGLAGGAAGGVDAHHLLARNREELEGVVFAHVVLDRERELGNGLQVLQVLGPNASGVELGAVVRHVVIGVLEAPLQALQLQGLDFVAAGALDRVEHAGRLLHDGHRCLLEEWKGPSQALAWGTAGRPRKV